MSRLLFVVSVVNALELKDHLNKQAKTLSAGLKRKVRTCLHALPHEPGLNTLHQTSTVKTSFQLLGVAAHFQVNVKFITSVPGSGVQVPVQHLSPSPSEILSIHK